MTKMYEALENAGKERGTAAAGKRPKAGAPPKPVEEKLLALGQRLQSAIDGGGGKVVEFVGIHNGDDCSKLVSALARALTSRLNKRVLLLSAGPQQYSLTLNPSFGAQGWEGVIAGEQRVEDVVHGIEGSTLSVGQIAARNDGLSSILASAKAREIFSSLRSRFDLILVDAPALGAHWDGVLLSPMVDGVVVVIEAGRTRWQVVRNGMAQIEEQRGHVLGVVLNKQRRYIPGFVYRKLL